MGAPRFSFLIYLAIGTVLIIPSVLCACYHPDGTRDMDEVWQPCSEFGGSMCCATNRTNAARGDLSNGTTSDVCLPNGLCINEGLDNGKLYQSYWRDYCTDSNWRDGNCLRVCLDRPVRVTSSRLSQSKHIADKLRSDKPTATQSWYHVMAQAPRRSGAVVRPETAASRMIILWQSRYPPLSKRG